MQPACGLVPTPGMPLPRVLATRGNAFCESWQLHAGLPCEVSNLFWLYSREGHCCVCLNTVPTDWLWKWRDQLVGRPAQHKCIRELSDRSLLLGSTAMLSRPPLHHGQPSFPGPARLVSLFIPAPPTPHSSFCSLADNERRLFSFSPAPTGRGSPGSGFHRHP